jgi:hypothetical protein
MTFQPGANVYTQAFGSRPENVEVPHLDVRAPATTDILYPVGKRWVNTVGNAEYVLTSFSASGNITTANWSLLGTNTGALNTLTGDSGGAISPSAGNITLSGTAGQIATTGSGSSIALSLIGPYTPASYTAHTVLLGEGSSAIGTSNAGTNGQLLIGSTGADPAFSTVTSTGGTITVTGGAHSLNLDIVAPLTVANGGTGDTTLTAHGVLLGEGTSAIVATAVGATGQALVGNTGADPTWTGSPSFSGSVTAATGLTVTAGGAAITGLTTINNSGAAATTIGTGGTGAVNIGNATGNTAVTGSLTASTTLTATLGAITATNGNVVLGTAGNKLNSTSVGTTTAAGANSFGTVALVGGTATVATTAVTANSMIHLTSQALGTVTVPSALAVTAKTAGTSFVITASQVTDTSTIAWFIIN